MFKVNFIFDFAVKKKLETKFEKIAERIVTLALETADYDEERAEQFLKSTITEDQKFEIEHLTSEKYEQSLYNCFILY